MKLGSDARVEVIEIVPGGPDRKVRLYPIDARDAIRLGSHRMPEGESLPGSDKDEVERLRARNAELEAQLASKPSPQGQAPAAGKPQGNVPIQASHPAAASTAAK